MSSNNFKLKLKDPSENRQEMNQEANGKTLHRGLSFKSNYSIIMTLLRYYSLKSFFKKNRHHRAAMLDKASRRKGKYSVKHARVGNWKKNSV